MHRLSFFLFSSHGIFSGDVYRNKAGGSEIWPIVFFMDPCPHFWEKNGKSGNWFVQVLFAVHYCARHLDNQVICWRVTAHAAVWYSHRDTTFFSFFSQWNIQPQLIEVTVVPTVTSTIKKGEMILKVWFLSLTGQEGIVYNYPFTVNGTVPSVQGLLPR